jgi:hypothetical protein
VITGTVGCKNWVNHSSDLQGESKDTEFTNFICVEHPLTQFHLPSSNYEVGLHSLWVLTTTAGEFQRAEAVGWGWVGGEGGSSGSCQRTGSSLRISPATPDILSKVPPSFPSRQMLGQYISHQATTDCYIHTLLFISLINNTGNARVLVSSTTCVCNLFHSRKTYARCHQECTHVFTYSTPYYCQILIKI